MDEEFRVFKTPEERTGPYTYLVLKEEDFFLRGEISEGYTMYVHSGYWIQKFTAGRWIAEIIRNRWSFDWREVKEVFGEERKELMGELARLRLLGYIFDLSLESTRDW